MFYYLRRVIIPTFYIILLVLSIPPDVGWMFRVSFVLFGLYVYWISAPIVSSDDTVTAGARISSKTMVGVTIGLFLFFLATRLYPFVFYGPTPLGYDTGGYLFYFHLITTTKYIGNTLIGNHLAYLPWFPLSMLGLNGMTTLNVTHIFYQLLTFGAWMFVVSSVPFPQQWKTPARFLSIALYALSINQFLAYWWMFYKQSMALPFLLLTIGFILRRSFVWTAFFFIVTAGIHIQSVIPLSAALIVYGALLLYRSYRKGMIQGRTALVFIGGGIITLVTVLVVQTPSQLKGFLDIVVSLRGFTTNANPWEVANFKGLYIPFDIARLNMVFILPFTYLGLLSFRRSLDAPQPATLFLAMMTGVYAMLVMLPTIYQQRSIIVFEFLLILVATIPLWRFIDYVWHERAGRAIVTLFFVGLGLYSSLIIFRQEPHIYQDEITAMKAIPPLRKSGEYAMTISAYYTPWVFLYTSFEPTIVPGWLYWQRWDLSMWKEFWYGKSNERRHELLAIYDRAPIYIFIGRRDKMSDRLKTFIETDPSFRRMNTYVWKYTPPSAP